MSDKEQIETEEFDDLEQIKRIFRLVGERGEEMLAVMRLAFLCEIIAIEKKQRWQHALDQKGEKQERAADAAYEEMTDEVIVYLHNRGFEEERIAAIMNTDRWTIDCCIKKAKEEGKISE